MAGKGENVAKPSEMDKLRAKLAAIDIDADLLIGEIAGAVKEDMPEVDIGAINAKIVEEVGKIGTALKGQIDEVRGSLDMAVNQFKGDLPSLVQSNVETVLAANLNSIIRQVGEQFKARAAEAGGEKGLIPRGGTAVEQILPVVIERLIKPSGGGLDDLFKQMENLARLKQAFDAFTPGAPSPDAQWKFGQEAFVEGLKIGRTAKGGAAANPLPPETSARPLGESARHTPKPRKSDEEIVREFLG